MRNNQCDRLSALYGEIQNCHKCDTMDATKALRRVESVRSCVQAMLVAEAMAESQVRISGVEYHYSDGKKGAAGVAAEKFLAKFGFSLTPGSGNCIYATEIVHCFPGKNMSHGACRIRRPTTKESTTCVGMGFLEREIEIVDPRVIFLMGATSFEAFYQHVLRVEKPVLLSRKIEGISRGLMEFDTYRGIPLIPMQHSSGANPGFHAMLRDDPYADAVRRRIGTIGDAP